LKSYFSDLLALYTYNSWWSGQARSFIRVAMQQRYVVSFFSTFLLHFFQEEASGEIVETEDGVE
jgi:hypothetical protein